MIVNGSFGIKINWLDSSHYLCLYHWVVTPILDCSIRVTGTKSDYVYGVFDCSIRVSDFCGHDLFSTWSWMGMCLPSAALSYTTGFTVH